MDLPGIYKDLFSMKYIYGLRNSEMAEIYEVSESTIRKRLQRGRKVLEDILEENWDEA